MPRKPNKGNVVIALELNLKKRKFKIHNVQEFYSFLQRWNNKNDENKCIFMHFHVK